MASARSRSWLARFGPPLGFSALFLALILPNIGAPQLLSEEAFEVVLAHDLLTTPAQRAERFWLEVLPTVRLFGRHWPLMEDTPYVGPAELYLQQPLFWLLGVNALSIRLLSVLATLFGLLCAHAVLRRWFSPAVAAVTLGLTLTHPIVVHFAKEGHDKEEVFTLAFFWSALYLVQRYLDGGGRRGATLLGAGLLVGLGLGHKITFLWYVAGLALVALVLPVRPLLRQLRPRHLAGAAAGMLLGVAPVLLYNLQTGGRTVAIMWHSLFQPTLKDNVDNSDYPHNAWVRLQQLADVLVKGEMWEPTWFPVLRGHSFVYNWPFFIAFFVALLAVPLLSRRGLAVLPGPRVRWVFALFAGVFLCSPFTVSSHNPSHLLPMVPFPGLAVALLLVALPALWPARRRLAIGLGALLCVAIIGFNLYLTIAYHLRARASMGQHYAPLKPFAHEDLVPLHPPGPRPPGKRAPPPGTHPPPPGTHPPPPGTHYMDKPDRW